MNDLPKPPALFTTMSALFVQSMQLPGLRMPTLEEYLMEQSGMAGERRAESILRLSTPMASATAASDQVATARASPGRTPSNVAPKKKCKVAAGKNLY